MVIELGQCGNQVGVEFFNLFYEKISNDPTHHPSTLFRVHEGELVARAVAVDTEPKVILQVQANCRKLRHAPSNSWRYAAENCIGRHCGAANNWAYG